MKKLLITISIILFNIISAQDRVYWVVWELDIDPNHVGYVINNFDESYDKNNKPNFNMALREIVHSDDLSSGSYEMVAWSTDRSALTAIMDNGYTLEDTLSSSNILFNDVVKLIGSRSGYTLSRYLPSNFDENTQSEWATSFQMNVKDPKTYAVEWMKMMKKSSEKPQTASFGQILMGKEPGISHYVFTTASSYDEMMKAFEVNFSSKAFIEFVSKVVDIREMVSTKTYKNLKFWMGN